MRGDKLELLNDQSAVEFDHLRAILKPFKRGFLSVQFVALEWTGSGNGERKR